MMISLFALILTGSPAATFAASIGENLHIDQSIGQWKNYAFIESLLKNEGIQTVRTSGTIYNDGGAHLAFMNKLNADLGITSDEIFGASVTTPQQVTSVLAARKGVAFIEPPNEQDICCGDSAWVAHDQATLAQLVTARKSYPAVSILAPSVSMGDPAMLGDLTGQAQYGNAHIYYGGTVSAREPETGGWGGPVYGQIYGSLAYNIAAAQRAMPDASVVATEAGYTTALVTESTQASYLERMMFLNWLAGIKKTWLYDFLDDAQSEGVARADGSLKPAAYGMQGIMALAKDSKTFQGTCSLNASITTSANYRSALLCKSNGEKDLVLWNPVELQDPNTGAATPAAPVTLTVTTNTTGKTRVSTQSTAYRWSSGIAKYAGNIKISLTERPTWIAFNAGPGPILGALPIIGTGLMNGKPITPSNAHISSGN